MLNRTNTFARMELISTKANWLSDPPQVRLSVRTKKVLTPKQVRLLEKFVEKEMGQDFQLIFQVSQYEEVKADTPASKSKP